jgi:dolichyl-phosphate beta-glucosyltransferase
MTVPADQAPFLTVIIPCYNERERLSPSLKTIRSFLNTQPFDAEIIVVDDGSTDDTVGVAHAEAAVRVLRYEVNRGKGYAVRQGVREARGQAILFTDADLSTPIDELNKLLPMLERGCDIAIGSRALDRSLVERRQAWWREWAGRCFNGLARMLTGLETRDSQCGFKLIAGTAARQIFPRLTIDRWAFDVEMLVAARRLGYSVCETPVRWRNCPNSKVHVMRDLARTLGDLVRIRRRWLSATALGRPADEPARQGTAS